ncbi:hypothetical protein BHE74_00047805 [Ensete ventricosum]|nr:hypothetical protein BHE74_00047805 [Ensete ventricosum]
MQDGAGEVDAGEPEELQSRRRGEPTHDPGVPAVVVGDLTDVRQRGDVEPAVGAVGAALLGRQLYISMLSPESHLFLRQPSLFLPSLPPQPAIPAISLPSLAACTKSHRRSPAAPAFCSQPLPPATATATLVSSSKKIAAATLTDHGRCLLPSLPADHTPLRPLLQRRPPHLPPLLPRRTPLLSRCCSPRRTPLPPLFPAASAVAKPFFTAAKPSSAFSSLGRLFLHRPPLFLSSLPPPSAIPASPLLPLCFPSHLPLRPTQTAVAVAAALLVVVASSSSTPYEICGCSPLPHSNVTAAATARSAVAQPLLRSRSHHRPQLLPPPLPLLPSSPQPRYRHPFFLPVVRPKVATILPCCRNRLQPLPPLLSSSSLCHNRIYRGHPHPVVAT